MNMIKLLLVDDDATTRSYYQYVLTNRLKYPCEVIEASSGQEALYAFQHEKIDCVILDYQLSDATGLDILKIIQKSNQQPTPPILISIDKGHEDIVIEAMKTGATDYLVKNTSEPYPLIEKMNNVLDQMLSKQQMSANTVKNLAIYGTGIIICLASTFILLDWIINTRLTLQMFANFVPIRFNAVLCFLLTGINLLFYPKRGLIPVLISIVIFVISAGTLLEYALSRSLGIDTFFALPWMNKVIMYPGRMAPNTALYFVIVSFVFFNRFTNKHKQIIDFVLSLFLTLAGLMAILGYLIGFSAIYAWGNLGEMSPIAAFLFLLTGIGLSIYFWFENVVTRYQRNILFPIGILVIGCLTFIVFWQLLIVNEYHMAMQVIKNNGQMVSKAITLKLTNDAMSLEQMRQRMDQNMYQSFADWRADADNVMRDLPEIVSISLSVKDKPLFMIHPQKVNQSLVNQCVSHPSNHSLLISHHGKNYLCMQLPVPNHQEKTILYALINLNAFFQKLIAETISINSYGILIKHQDNILYGDDGNVLDLISKWGISIPIAINSATWQLTIWPHQSSISAYNRWLPIMGLIISLLVTFLLVFSIRILQLSKRKSLELKESEQTLYSVLNTTSDAIIVVNKEGSIHFANQAFLSLSEYSKSEISHILLASLFSLPNQNRDDHELPQLSLMPQVERDRRLRSKYGKLIAVEIQTNPIEINHESCCLYSIRDIQKIKDYEQKLLKKAQLLHLMFNITSSIMEERAFNIALKNCLTTLCVGLKWPIGHVYFLKKIDNEDIITPSDIWYHDPNVNIDVFKHTTMNTTFSHGIELPGRILAAGRCTWVENLLADIHFRRKLCNDHVSIQSAVGFPIKIQGNTAYIFELFNFETMEEDNDVVLMLNILSETMGNLFERRQTEEALKQKEIQLQKTNNELEKIAKVTIQQKKKLQHYAYFDSLTTDLLNRRGFEEKAAFILNSPKKQDQSVSFLFIDIDHYKNVNDQYGHRTGDIVLIEVGKRLKSILHKNDIIGRMGGDEFGVLLVRKRNKETVTALAEEIIKMISQPLRVEHKFLNITISIGIAHFSKDSVNLNELMKHADEALLLAKSKGRSRFEIYEG